MRIKKTVVLSFFVVAAMLLSFATACTCNPAPTPTIVVEPTQAVETGPTQAVEPGPTQAAEPGEKVKVTIFVGLGAGTAPSQVETQEALAEKFNATHDDIEIEFLIVPYDESRERLLAMLAGGTVPGLVGPNGVMAEAEFFDVWADITPFIEAENYDMSDFYGPTVELHQYADRTLGLPFGVYPSMIFYNKDLFDAAGVDYPTHDYADTSWTMDALRDMAMKLTLDSNGNDATSSDFNLDDIVQYGYDDSWATGRAQLTIWDAPDVGRPTSADYRTAVANSKEWVEGLQWYSDAIWKDRFMADYTGQDAFYATAGDPFSSGILAMHYSHTWYLVDVLGSDVPFEFDFAPLPYNLKGTRVTRINADTWNIPKDAENKEASWEVMKWLVSPENIVETTAIYGMLPARKSVEAEARAALAARIPGTDLDVVYGSIDYLDKPNSEEWVPEYTRIDEILQQAMDLIYTGENKDAQSVLDEANDQIQQLLDQYWANQ